MAEARPAGQVRTYRPIGPPTRRAPRLGPDERIAPHVTRRGRFLKIDPLEAKPVPGLARLLGVVGWAVLTVDSLRRARRLVAGGQPRRER